MPNSGLATTKDNSSNYLNNVKIDKPDLYKLHRKVADITFRDKLTWYIEKEFKSSGRIKYE